MPSTAAPGPPDVPLSVVAVTRRAVRTGRDSQIARCEREVLTPDSTLPDHRSRADVVVVAYNPDLTAEERAAVTGPPERTARHAFAGVRGVEKAWQSWARDVLAAHQRIYPEDVGGARRELDEPPNRLWGSHEGSRGRRLWQELVVAVTLPRPVDGAHPVPLTGRWTHQDGTVWETPTEPAGVRFGQADYTTTARRFVTLAEDLRSGRVAEGSPEHVRGFVEAYRLCQRTHEAGRRRVDWAPVLYP